MDITSTVRYLSTQNEQIEENILPKKPNRLKETRIVNTKTLIILNFPLEPRNLHKLYEYCYFGQFKNIKAIHIISSPNQMTLNTLIEFRCDISAALSFFVS